MALVGTRIRGMSDSAEGDVVVFLVGDIIDDKTTVE
jgi:hypothetical protein